jgi:DNA-binding transcriptional regulator GbsR (MarR family)
MMEVQIVNRDSLVYIKLSRITKKHLHWIGLSEAAQDVLTALLVEHYWTKEPLSTDDMLDLTGYSRGSISVAISQLRNLGFIESRTDTSHPGRGRKPTFYEVAEGMSGIVTFGVRRLSLELEGILREVESMKFTIDVSDTVGRNALNALGEETNRNLDQLRKYTRQIIASRVLSETITIE